MKPMMAGMLTMPSVKNSAKTPPISASGRFSSTTADCVRSRNWANSSRKITAMDMIEVMSSVRDAACALSNCPPYSMR